METKVLPNVVLIHVNLPVAVNERKLVSHPQVGAVFSEMETYSREFEVQFFQDEAEGQFVKIGEGAFLADQDAWHPHILAMMKWCGEKKFSYVVVPVGDSLVRLSEANQDVARWLSGKGRKVHLTRPVSSHTDRQDHASGSPDHGR